MTMACSVDKARGMMLAAALGDSLGAPCEYGQSPSRFTGSFHDGWKQRRTNQWGFTVEHVVGQVTDDTEMMAALLGSILTSSGDYVRDNVIKAYIEWANSGTYSLGTNTRALLKGVKTVSSYEKRFVKAFPDDAAKERSQSNGHLMRCAPLALLICDDNSLHKTIQTDVSITNPSHDAWYSFSIGDFIFCYYH